jgi:autotransporter-associated beta strand protein
MNRPHLVLPAAVLAALSVATSPVCGQTWLGPGTDWNTGANWSTGTVPNSTSAVVSFNGASPFTVNISTSVSALALNFNNPSGSYVLTSSPNQTLSGVLGITVAAGVTGTETINLASIAAGSLLIPTNSNLAFTNNSTAAGTTLVVGSNTVIGTSGGSSGVLFAGPGNSQFTGSTGLIEGVGKRGPGTFTFSGNGSNIGGANAGVSLEGGTLILDYATNLASKLGGGVLTLDGGVLSLTANAGTPVTQTVANGTFVFGGQTDVKATGIGTITLAAGAISRPNIGATADFSPVTGSLTFGVTTSATTTNGLLGAGPAFATVGGGSTWATASGGAVAGLPAGSYTPNTYSSGTNTDVTVTGSAPASFTTNSLRFNTGSVTLTLSGTNTLQSGGILATPSASGATITGGSLTAPSSGELLFHTYGSGPLIINSALVSATGLTKTGPGTLTLEAANPGLTGPINVNRGGLAVTTTAAVNSASTINFTDNRPTTAPAGLQQFVVDLGTNTNGTISPPISMSAFSPTAYGTVFSTGVSTGCRVTLSGVLSSAPGLTTPIRFTGDVSNTSGFNLTNSGNSFTGNVSVRQGSLGITADACLGPLGNTLILDTVDTNAGGLEFLNGGVTITRPILVNSSSRVVSDGSDSNTISGTVTSANSGPNWQFVKGGTGTLTFSGTGTNLTGGLTLSGGTLVLDYSTNLNSKLGGGALTLNGGVLSLTTGNVVLGVFQSIPGGTVVNSGHTDINAPSATVTLAAGAISHSVGGTADFVLAGNPSSPTSNATTTTGVTNGLLGAGPAFATVYGGSTWATVSSGQIVGLTTYGTNAYGSGINTDVTTSASVASFTTSSLRFNTNSPSGTFLTLSGTNTLQSGGILVTPSFSGGAINGGTLTAPSSGELLVHDYSSNGITINSALGSTAGLTKTGFGLLTLAGNNIGLTGPINVNRGSIDVRLAASVNSASAINFNDARPGAELQLFVVDLGNGVSGTISPPIRISAFSATDYGTYFNAGFGTGSTVTLAGVINSPVGLTTSLRFTSFDTSNTSGFNLTNANTFTGNISLQHGPLGITSDASLGNPANVLTLEVADANNGGLVFLNTGVTVARPVVLNSVTRVVSNGTDSNTISGQISGIGALVKAGTGTLTLASPINTFTGGLSVAAGTLTLGATGALAGGTNITVGNGATFSPGTTSNNIPGVTPINMVTLNGGTFRRSAGTNLAYVVNQIVTNASGGTIDFTGAGFDGLALASIGTTGPAISVNGNSTWLSPANTSIIENFTAMTVPITIPAGVTLTNGLALFAFSTTTGGYQVSGGGTLFQNSDATNVVNMDAPITVAQGSTFRVTDVTTNVFGNLGAGLFTLDGGTFSYGGSTATLKKVIFLTANGGTIQVESATATLTADPANAAIIGPGPLTKIGPGTLVLGTGSNSFTSLTINGGTVQALFDFYLGSGPVSIGPFGTLTYTGTSSTGRTFTMNSGTISVAAGQTLTLNGAGVGGGFLRGPGAFALTGGTTLSGVTTSGSTVINQIGAASFTNFTNGGPLTISGGLAAPTNFTVVTNQGGGAITIGANDQVNASDFQTYGTLTLSPGSMAAPTQLTNTGSSPLFFNGGSRTFIATPQTAGQFLAGIDLNGKNAVVAGGLFVNNGYVIDSTGGSSTVVADFGSLVKGAGFYQNGVITINGGKFQAGNSPGSASFGKFVLGPGGVDDYVFAIDDATGAAGPKPDALGHVSGWSLVQAVRQPVGTTTTPGDFTWTATPADKLSVALDTLLNPTTVGTDRPGPMDHFDPNHFYVWPAAEWAGSYSGPTDAAALDAATSLDTSGFVNPVAGAFGWSLDPAGHTLSLTYTPSAVPEPGTLALLGAAGMGWAARRRFSQIRA